MLKGDVRKRLLFVLFTIIFYSTNSTNAAEIKSSFQNTTYQKTETKLIAEKGKFTLDFNDSVLANEPPVVEDLESSDIDYKAGDGEINITSEITISDADNTTMQSAVVSITSGYNNSEDALSFTVANGINGLWKASSGTLDLTGEASIDNYESTLRSVKYENTNTKNPSIIY